MLEAVFPNAKQRAAIGLFQVELDGRARLGRISPFKDESLGRRYLEDEAIAIGVDVRDVSSRQLSSYSHEISTGRSRNRSRRRPASSTAAFSRA
jgi:hypothetical protein